MANTSMTIVTILAVAFVCSTMFQVSDAWGSHGKGIGKLLGIFRKDRGPDLKDLYDDLSARVANVERRGCDTGYVYALICNPDAWYDECTHKYIPSQGLQVLDIPVNYNRHFYDFPVVVAGLSGVYTSGGKNCTVEASEIQKDQFNLRVTLGGYLPFELRMFWIACDAAAYAVY